MWCGACQNEFPSDCKCSDRDERLARLGMSRHLAMTYCSGCGEYYSLCKCPAPKPEREKRVQGRII